MIVDALKALARRFGPARGAPRLTSSATTTDSPISTAGQDRLRRSVLVSRIADVLSEPMGGGGRVFAIRGDWGSGKSSLKNLVIEQLAARSDAPRWLQFNPWQWRDADAIARGLYVEIADKLGSAHSRNAARRAAKLRRYGAILTGTATSAGKLREGATLAALLGNGAVLALAASIGLALPSVAAVAAALAVAAAGVTVAGKILIAIGRDRSGAPLDDVREDLEESLRALDRPLVVFVDDIDRLEPEEIREVMRQVKANGALPNIAFVLLFQPSIVEAALDPISNGEGRSFLEKIVQTNFDLPATPPAVFHRLLTEELGPLAGRYASSENGFEEVRWGNVLIGCIQPRIRNLRDVRRYLSSVAAHLPLQEGSALEVNLIDFLCLEALRVFEPALHGRLFAERELLLQTSRFRQDGRDAQQKAQVEALLEIVRADARPLAADTLKELFPTIEWAFGGTHYGEGFYQRWLAAKRVCTQRYFPRYFELQTPEGEVSESEFSELIAVSDDASALSGLLERVEARGMLPSLAARFDESAERLPPKNVATLLPEILIMGQKLVSSRNSGSFNSPWLSAWRAASWYLRGIPASDRGKMLLEALRRTGALSVVAILIHLNDPADRNEDEARDFVPDINAADLELLKAEWLRQLGELAAEPDRLLSQPDLTSLLYRWRDYTGSLDAPRHWVAEVSSNDRAFAMIVSSLMSRGTSQGWGDRVAARHDTFRRETVEEIIGVEEAARRLAEVDRSELPEEERRALEVLDQHLSRWLAGKVDD